MSTAPRSTRVVDIHPGERALDIAAGSGNAALARRAARRGRDRHRLRAAVTFNRTYVGPAKAVFDRLDPPRWRVRPPRHHDLITPGGRRPAAKHAYYYGSPAPQRCCVAAVHHHACRHRHQPPEAAPECARAASGGPPARAGKVRQVKHGADEGSLRRSRLLGSWTATRGERRNRATWLSSLHPGLTLCGLSPRQPPAHRTGSSGATSRRLLGGASTAANSRRSDLPGEPRLLTVRDQPWTWAARAIPPIGISGTCWTSDG